MPHFRADLHIHSVLSPCGSLDNSPSQIVQTALARHLQLIAVTDHNTLRHCELVCELAAEAGIVALRGVEITTAEEAHVLAYLPDADTAAELQAYIDMHRSQLPNDEERFGYQVIVDRNEQILDQEPYLLTAAIAQSVEQVAARVKQLGGIFIPAHVDKSRFSLTSQLGLIPLNLPYDALELSRHCTHERFSEQHSYLGTPTIIRNSDAHYLEHIGQQYTVFQLNTPSFHELKLALQQAENRCIISTHIHQQA